MYAPAEENLWRRRWSNLGSFQFRVLEMPFPVFSTGHFQQTSMQVNAVVGCLFFLSLVLSVRYSLWKKGQRCNQTFGIIKVTEIANIDTTITCEKCIIHPKLMME